MGCFSKPQTLCPLLVLAALGWARAGFASPSPFHPVSPGDLPVIAPEGDLPSFKTALERQIKHCESLDLNERFRIADRMVTRRQWCIDTDEEFLKIASSASSFAEVVKEARTRFDWYQTEGRDGRGQVLFTAYDFPLLQGSIIPTPQFQVPLYRQPPDLVEVVEDGKLVWRKKNADGTYGPYPDREAIDVEGALAGKGLELAFTTDPFSAFILQVAGSGAILLPNPDGTRRRVVLDYAAQNGRPYVSIAQVLRNEGVPEAYLTIPGMRLYFKLHPERLMPTLLQNPSYVFFRQESDGPYGSEGVLLSPRHSIAVDLRVFPLGAVAFFQTQRPRLSMGELSGWKSFSTLAVTQDTGGAIVGPGHIDIYWGEGQEAEDTAGVMQEEGTLYLAIARQRAPLP